MPRVAGVLGHEIFQGPKAQASAHMHKHFSLQGKEMGWYFNFQLLLQLLRTCMTLMLTSPPWPKVSESDAGDREKKPDGY